MITYLTFKENYMYYSLHVAKVFWNINHYQINSNAKLFKIQNCNVGYKQR